MRRLYYAPVLLLIAVMMAIAFPFAAQEETPEATPEATAESTETPVDVGEPAAFIRVGHFVPDGDAVDVIIDDESGEATDVAYSEMSDWLVVTPGDHTIAVVPAGSEDAVAGPVQLELTNREWLTVLVVPNAADEGVGLSLVKEDPSVGPPGTANIAFASALASGAAVNFLRDGVVYTAGIAPITDGSVVQNSIPIDAGTYMYSATLSETDEPIAVEPVEVDAVDTSMHLIVLAGTPDAPEIYTFETPREQMLLLTGELEEPGTLIEAARGNENLSTFLALVEQAGLTDRLSAGGPYTVFAPANFVLDELLASSDFTDEELATLLANHIVEGNLKLTDLMDMETVTSLDGNDLAITEDEQLYVNGAQIIDTNIPSTNGTIHIINNVLTPDGESD